MRRRVEYICSHSAGSFIALSIVIGIARVKDHAVGTFWISQGHSIRWLLRSFVPRMSYGTARPERGDRFAGYDMLGGLNIGPKLRCMARRCHSRSGCLQVIVSAVARSRSVKEKVRCCITG